MSEPQPPPVPTAPTPTRSSRSVRHPINLAPNQFQREVLAPDKYPQVRWHSKTYVSVCRHFMDFVIFLLGLILALLIGPSVVAFLYPSVIFPFMPRLEWKCVPPQTLIHIHSDNLVLETNLLAASAPVKIQLFLSDSRKKFDDLDKILLVIDDCSYDHSGDNVMLCQPLLNYDERPTFEQHVQMAMNCYHYIRQATRHAKISAYGKGITANILAAAAVRLRNDSCYHFENLYLVDPIVDIQQQFLFDAWIDVMFSIPMFREKLLKHAYRAHGLEGADLLSNIKKIGKTPVKVLSEKNDEEVLAKIVAPARKITLTEFKYELTAKVTTPPRGMLFQFRHAAEEECAAEFRKPVTLLQVLV